MAGLGYELQQRLMGGAPAARRKRRRADDADDADADEDGAARRQRRKINNDDDDDDDTDDGVGPNAAAAGGGGEVVFDGASVFTSLDEAHARTVREALARTRAPEAVRSAQRECLLCEYGNHGFDMTAAEGCRALAEMNNYYVNYYKPFSKMACARAMWNIYERHVQAPARQLYASVPGADARPAGALPPGIVPLSMDDVLVHLTYHDLSPLATNIYCIESTRKLSDALMAKYEIEGVPDVRTADTALRAIAQLHRFNASFSRDLGRGAEVQLDPAKMLAMTSAVAALEPLQTRSTSALGGATGITDAPVARPNFGAAPPAAAAAAAAAELAAADVAAAEAYADFAYSDNASDDDGDNEYDAAVAVAATGNADDADAMFID